jgi:hypothetical protein
MSIDLEGLRDNPDHPPLGTIIDLYHRYEEHEKLHAQLQAAIAWLTQARGILDFDCESPEPPHQLKADIRHAIRTIGQVLDRVRLPD